MTWISRLLAAALALAAAQLLLAAEAQAHASFVRSDPADGSVLTDAPERLQLVFSEPVSPLVLTLVGPSADPVRLDRYHLHNATLIIESPGGLSDGSYALSWRVTSTDGHPVGGSVVFSIGAPSANAPATEAVGSGELRPLIWAVKLVLYFGLFFGIGVLSFHAFIAPAPVPAGRVSLVLIGVGLAALVPSFGLHGLDLMGASLAEADRVDVWASAYSSSYGRTLLIAAVSLAIGLAAWLAPIGWPVRILSVAALAGVAAALAASGHASAAEPQWLMRPVVFLHALGITAWAGSLVPFAMVLRGGGDAARRMLTRFSAAILPVIAVLVLAGTVLAVVQVESVEALWTTSYGLVLLAKLGLLLLLFTLAAINRFSLTPAFARREPKAAQQFARSVRMEVALVCVILAVASLWRFTPPPRSLVSAESVSASVHLVSAKAMAELAITPGTTGPVIGTAHVMTNEMTPPDPLEVTLSLSNPSAGIEPIRRPMTKGDDGNWLVDSLTIPVTGTWNVGIDILISDFEATTLEGEITIVP